MPKESTWTTDPYFKAKPEPKSSETFSLRCSGQPEPLASLAGAHPASGLRPTSRRFAALQAHGLDTRKDGACCHEISLVTGL